MKEIIKNLRQHPLVKKHNDKIKFVLVGGFNTVLDFCIFGTLANIFKLPIIVSNIISTTICTAISFLLNYKYVWRTKKSKRETAPGFLAVSLFTAWVVQNIAINSVVFLFGDGAIAKLAGKAFGSACGMVSNYLGYKIVFRGKSGRITLRRHDEEPKQSS